MYTPDIEYSIAEYLVQHGETIKQDYDKEVPIQFEEIYQEQLIARYTIHIAEALGFTYEQVADVVDEGYITKLLGKDFLKCQKKFH